MQPLRNSSGMTLIEVLVALVVIALSLGAVITSINQSVTDFDAVRTRSFAHWVAMNRAVELQLALSARAGTTETQELLAGRDWRVETTISAIAGSEVLRANIRVLLGEEDERALADVIAYIGKTPPVTEKQEQTEEPADGTDNNNANDENTASQNETSEDEQGP